MKKKNFTNDDPHYSREAQKYDSPVPSREYVIQLLKALDKPIKAKALFERLQMLTEAEQQAMRNRLRAMLRDGQLHLDRRGRYSVMAELDLVRGRVQGHPDGFGFLIPDDGRGDLFISPRQMRKVLDGDVVLVQEVAHASGGQGEAVVHQVVERPMQNLIGMLVKVEGKFYLEPENKRIGQTICIPESGLNHAEDGQIVMVKLDNLDAIKGPVYGQVTEVLGDHAAPGMDIDVALRVHGIPSKWPDDVAAAVTALEKAAPPSVGERVDCRSQMFVTIDGDDAKDFDDAVYCEPGEAGGWRLWVAIADVSHYVKPGTPIDAAASARGTSVYFPGRVVPMLPEVLSNNLCSLRPETDRLTMMCEMNVDRHGQLQNSKFYEAIIHSQARLTYTEVAAMLVDPAAATTPAQMAWLPHLHSLHALYQALVTARKKRGAIEFDSTECQVLFDEDDRIAEIKPIQRNDAHRLIEECMLLANVATAEFLQKHRLPVLYRVHEPPKEKKVAELRAYLAKVGLSLPGDKVPPVSAFSALIAATKDHVDRHLIQTIVLRTLSQAVYTTNNQGHFGLAYDAYAHFTSPIRRYPDLLAHRAIKAILNVPGYQDYPQEVADVTALGEHFSATERRAEEASRDVLLALKCEYMLDQIGQVFTGVISSVVQFGLFIELPEFYVDGLLHVTALPDDYYQFDSVMHTLIGERTGKRYKLGDTIRVLVARVDLNQRKIDFELA